MVPVFLWFASADGAFTTVVATVHSAPIDDRAAAVSNDQEQTTLVAVSDLCVVSGDNWLKYLDLDT